MDDVERQRIVDEVQLRALAIGYFTLGGMAAFAALIALVYIAMGVVIGTVAGAAGGGGSDDEAKIVGMVLGAIGTTIFVGFGVVSALQITTGISLLRGRRRNLAIVTAALSCIWIPFGTVLGVLTLVVLLRESVAERFRGGPIAAPGVVDPV